MSEPDELICRECDETFQVEDGCDTCDYCHGCVYVVLDQLTAERDALKAERDELQKRVDYAWNDGFASAEAGLAENEAAEIRAPLKAEIERLKAEVAGYNECAADNRRLRTEFTELREALTEIDAQYRKQPEWNTPANGRCPECGYNTELLEALLAKLQP